MPSQWSLFFEMKNTGSELVFIGVLRLELGNAKAVSAIRHRWTSSEDFGLLRKTLDFFRNIQKWSCHFQKFQHSQDKNLTPIFQKKLKGIKFVCLQSPSILVPRPRRLRDEKRAMEREWLMLKGTVSQTAHVQVINQKWSDVFKFVICETKWRQQAEDNPHSHGGRRNNSGRKKFF